MWRRRVVRRRTGPPATASSKPLHAVANPLTGTTGSEDMCFSALVTQKRTTVVSRNNTSLTPSFQVGPHTEKSHSDPNGASWVSSRCYQAGAGLLPRDPQKGIRL